MDQIHKFGIRNCNEHMHNRVRSLQHMSLIIHPTQMLYVHLYYCFDVEQKKDVQTKERLSQNVHKNEEK